VRPVTSRVTISAPREEIFDFVADVANRIAFCDNYLKDFRLTRVNSYGVGAGAAFVIDSPLFPLRAEFQVVQMDRPRLLREQGRIGRWGRTPGFAEWRFVDGYGDTEIELTVWSEPATRLDALKEALGARRWLTRQTRMSLKRLRAIFEQERSRPLARATIAGYEPLKAARFGA
jgi:hypothetical protein